MQEFVGVGRALRIEKLVLECSVRADRLRERCKNLEVSVSLLGCRAEQDHAVDRPTIGCLESETVL